SSSVMIPVVRHARKTRTPDAVVQRERGHSTGLGCVVAGDRVCAEQPSSRERLLFGEVYAKQARLDGCDNLPRRGHSRSGLVALTAFPPFSHDSTMNRKNLTEGGRR